MQRLSDIYFDKSISDDEVIGRLLNTATPDNNDDPSLIGLNLLQHANAMMLHEVQNIVNRPKCKRILDALFEICALTPKSKEKFYCVVKHIKENYGGDDKNADSVYILCFCRVTWEIEYQDKIMYKTPHYATMEAIGELPFKIFCDSLKNDDYILT